jgi:hypothetical protein
MPKSLKFHSNERIDLPDFELASSGYAQALHNHLIYNSKISQYSQILRGFRVEIEDQAINPGQITLHSGVAFDRMGRILDIEDQPDASLTITLTGASQTFYLEVEFTESQSDQDSRGFWDPTIDNTSPVPDGGEVNVTVATRNTPSWKIVTPVSTSGFTYNSLPNSNRVPIAVLNTDASNEIDSSVNLFSSLEYAATTLVRDIAATATTLYVADSQLLPVGSLITIDFGGTAPEVTRTILSNDIDNGIITFSPAVAALHLAGAIVRRTDAGSNKFLPQQDDPNAAAYSAGTAATRPNDYRKKFYTANETTGSGLLASSSTFGERDDLSVNTEKDHVDYISAILREMKFGNPRSDVTSFGPPSAFSTRPRYFDNAGSIAGARSNSVSIGNGTTSFGDFNGSTEIPFAAAIAHLTPLGGGTIYIKRGTYTFSSQVTVPDGIDITFEGEHPNTVNLVNAIALTSAITVSSTTNTVITINNVSTTSSSGVTIPFLSSTGGITLSIFNSTVSGLSCASIIKLIVNKSQITGNSVFTTVLSGQINSSTFISISCTSITGVSSSGSSFTTITTSGNVTDCLFTLCFLNDVITASALINVVVDQCTPASGTLVTRLFNCSATSSRVKISNSKFSVTANNIWLQSAGVINGLTISNCEFISTTVATQTVPLFDFSGTSSVNYAIINNSIFNSPMTAASPVTSAFLFSQANQVDFSCCVFRTPGSLSTTSTNIVTAISVSTALRFSVKNCDFILTNNDTEFARAIHFVNSVHAVVNSCNFSSMHSCIHYAGGLGSSNSLTISDCLFAQAQTRVSNSILIEGSAGVKVSVTGCRFTAPFGTSAKKGISFASPSSSLYVDSCVFSNFGLNSVSGVFGIFTDSLATDSSFVIQGNTFKDFSGSSITGCVYLDGAGSTASVSGNSFKNIENTGNSYGTITVNELDNISIQNNTFTNIEGGAGLTGFGCGITTISCENVSIVNNTFIETLDAIIVSVIQNNAVGSTATLDVCSNYFNLNNSYGSRVTPVKLSNSVGVSSFICNKNTFRCRGTVTIQNCISIGDSPSVRPQGVMCNDNYIIVLDGIVSIDVIATDAVISNNNIYTADGSGGGMPGILVNTSQAGILVGNNIQNPDPAGAGNYNIEASGTDVTLVANRTNGSYDNASTGSPITGVDNT